MLSPAASPQQSLATNKEALAFCLQVLLAENNNVILSEAPFSEDHHNNNQQKDQNSTTKKQRKEQQREIIWIVNNNNAESTAKHTFLRTIKKRRKIFLYRGKEIISYLLTVFGSDLVNHLGGFAENIFDLGICYSVLHKAGIVGDGSSFAEYNSTTESCFPSFVEEISATGGGGENNNQDSAADAASITTTSNNNNTNTTSATLNESI